MSPVIENSSQLLEMMSQAYDQGFFPMADGPGARAAIHLYNVEKRAVLVPRQLHVGRSLGRTFKRNHHRGALTFHWNDDLRAVMTECARLRPKGQSWINPGLIDLYAAWPAVFCLSVFQGETRVGGIYGVQRGGLFAAESMFSRLPNASSLALIMLVAGLDRAGIELIDLQYANDHTRRFGLHEITHEAYVQELQRLKDKPVRLKADHFCAATAMSFVQSLTQTS